MPSILPGQIQKICCRCRRALLPSCFGRDGIQKDGLRNACRECLTSRRNELKAADRERFLNYQRVWRLRHPDRVKSENSAYYQKNRFRLQEIKREYMRIRRALRGKAVFLDAFVNRQARDGRQFHESIADPRALNPEQEAVASDLLAWKEQSLSEREQFLLDAFLEHGFDLALAAESLSVTEEVAAETLAAIRAKATAQFGDAYA